MLQGIVQAREHMLAGAVEPARCIQSFGVLGPGAARCGLTWLTRCQATRDMRCSFSQKVLLPLPGRPTMMSIMQLGPAAAAASAVAAVRGLSAVSGAAAAATFAAPTMAFGKLHGTDVGPTAASAFCLPQSAPDNIRHPKAGSNWHTLFPKMQVLMLG